MLLNRSVIQRLQVSRHRCFLRIEQYLAPFDFPRFFSMERETPPTRNQAWQVLKQDANWLATPSYSSGRIGM